MLYSKAHFAVRHAASTDERYNLNGIHFRADGSTEATDGHMLIRVTAPVPPDEEHPKGCGEEKPEPFVLPLDAANRIVKGMPKRSHMPALTYVVLDAPFTNGNGLARFISTDLEQDAVTESRKCEGEFPTADGTILKPDRHEEKPAFRLNLRLMERVIKAAKEIKGPRDPLDVLFYFTDDCAPIRMILENGDGERLEAVVMPMRID